MSAPLISVIIPTYNCAHYLGDAIESAFSQDYPRLEIIVVDDGSTDDTATLLATFGERLRKTHQSNGGIGSARNTGLTLASGEFIAYLDADDLYVPGKLTRQMACFDADPELDADFAATLAVDTSRPLAAPMASTTLIKRQALERVGPWSTELTVGTDLDWYARVQEKLVKCLMLDEVLLHRRVHRTNTNLVHAADKNERLHVIKAMLDRRRAQQRDTQ